MEVPAATSGILDSLMVSEGATVEVGSLLAIIVAGEKTGQSTTSVPKEENKKIDEQISEPKKDEDFINNVKTEVVEEGIIKILKSVFQCLVCDKRLLVD